VLCSDVVCGKEEEDSIATKASFILLIHQHQTGFNRLTRCCDSSIFCSISGDFYRFTQCQHWTVLGILSTLDSSFVEYSLEVVHEFTFIYVFTVISPFLVSLVLLY
jgi:hypothetical protein